MNNRAAALFAPALVLAVASHAVGKPDVEDLVKAYSTQRLVGLNVNDRYTFKLHNGEQRVVKLVSVKEYRDDVIHLMTRAEVRVEIDGKPLDLVCAPYVMPTVVAGMRIVADSTSGWGNVPKQVQLSIWDARDPIVNTELFGFPLRSFRFLSQGTQAYNEPVHLGLGDGDPSGGKFYHDYGFDMAGYEGRENVVSATNGTVAMFWPSRDDLCSVIVRDTFGFYWEYAHLCAVEPGIVLDAKVPRGEKIGLLGRTGPSGNFSHNHLGSYLTKLDVDIDHRDRRLNLYPWYVAAYQALHPRGLIAVALPDQRVLTGDKVMFDGSRSLVWGSARIRSFRWVFHDGTSAKGPLAEKAYDRAGAYVAELWVKDDKGNEDVDFCQIKVYTKDKPEGGIPHLFMTATPTEGAVPNQPVSVRCWFQGTGAGPIEVDFDDGATVADYKQYSELKHGFDKARMHVVTARCGAGGMPITQKLKVVVLAAPRVEDVQFTARCDGSPQRYMVLFPVGFDAREPHDLLIGLHGHGSDRHQYMESERDECRVARDEAAEHRMLFVSPDYRAPTSWMGPKAEADLLQIMGELKRRYRIGKVILCGGSMGGSSVLTFAAIHPDKAQGVVSMNGTANHMEYENFQDAIRESFGGTKAQIPEEYKRRSAEYWPERLTMPVAFTVGGKDDVVPPDSVIRLAGVLKKLQPDVCLIVDESGGHSTNYEDGKRAFDFVLERVLHSSRSGNPDRGRKP